MSLVLIYRFPGYTIQQSDFGSLFINNGIIITGDVTLIIIFFFYEEFNISLSVAYVVDDIYST